MFPIIFYIFIYKLIQFNCGNVNSFIVGGNDLNLIIQLFIFFINYNLNFSLKY